MIERDSEANIREYKGIQKRQRIPHAYTGPLDVYRCIDVSDVHIYTYIHV